MNNPVNRVEPVLAVYRELNGGTGSDISHIRDLITDLLHYVDHTNQGMSSYQLLDVVSEIFTEEKVESFHLENP